jgi:hypothetical protein
MKRLLIKVLLLGIFPISWAIGGFDSGNAGGLDGSAGGFS